MKDLPGCAFAVMYLRILSILKVLRPAKWICPIDPCNRGRTHAIFPARDWRGEAVQWEEDLMNIKLNRRQAFLGMASAAVLTTPALAAWPDRPVTILHGFAAGGNADVVARIIGEALGRRLKQSFVVEPKPGAGGTIAAGLIARANPDGYTLGILPGGHSVSAAIYKKLSFNPIDDFSTIGLISDFPFVLVTHPGHAAKNLRQMLELGEKNELTYGTPGNGTGQHMAAELLISQTGIKLRHVPYKGGSAAIVDLLAGRLDLVVDTPTVTIEHVIAKTLVAVGVTGSKRFFALPEVLTIAEQGVNGYETSSWLGLAGPAGLPQDIQTKLNADLRAVLNDPDTAEKLRKIGSNPNPTSSADFRKLMADDIAKWQRVVEQRNIPRI
jgi:tripartite-type tricarboxylate transporter receptor subunit TctC